MVPGDEPHDIIADHLVFIVENVIDSTDVETDASKDGLPARHGMGAHNWMRWGELEVFVEW